MLISVCVPTYNNAKYIAKTLHSICNQSYGKIEIIICDNASTDETERIVKSIKDKRIHYYRSLENIGAAENFNKCIQLSGGQLISVYHSDDVYDPRIVEKEADLLMSDPCAGAVFALDTLIDENDRILGSGVSLPKQFAGKSLFGFNQLYPALLQGTSNFLVCPTFMAWKKVFEPCGIFNSSGKYGDWIGGAADTELWLRICEQFKIGIVNERLIFRRISSKSGSGRYNTTYTTRSNHFIALDSFLNSKALLEPIDEKILKQYEFNKFWDDVNIANNLILSNMNNRPILHLAKTLSFQRLVTGFRSVKNIEKLIFYFGLMLASCMSMGGSVARLLPKIKRGNEI